MLNATVLCKVSTCEFGNNLFLYGIFNFDGSNGTVVPSGFPWQYYQSVAILTIFHPNHINKNISPFVIRCLVDLKRATDARDIDDDGHSVFGWGGLIYGFGGGARLDSTLIAI